MTDTTAVQDAATRLPYKTAAITLHWILAVLIIGQILGGWYMGSMVEDSPEQDNFELFHISVGLTILLFTFARIVVRLLNPPPELPSSISLWERVLSRISHFAFYGLMLALPFTGWALKSFGPRPIHFWGVIQWPKLPYLSTIARERGMPIYRQIESFHSDLLITATLVLLALHVAGAIKHQFDGAPVLWRMLPFLRKR